MKHKIAWPFKLAREFCWWWLAFWRYHNNEPRLLSRAWIATWKAKYFAWKLR